MRKTIVSMIVFALVSLPTMAMASGSSTYPPSPPPSTITVPPGTPPSTAFTGSDISTPVKWLFGLVVLGVIVLLGALLLARNASKEG